MDTHTNIQGLLGETSLLDDAQKQALLQKLEEGVLSSKQQEKLLHILQQEHDVVAAYAERVTEHSQEVKALCTELKRELSQMTKDLEQQEHIEELERIQDSLDHSDGA